MPPLSGDVLPNIGGRWDKHACGAARRLRGRDPYAPNASRSGPMASRERRQAPCLEDAGVCVPFDAKEHSLPSDVLVSLRLDARVPAVTEEFAIGRG